jgi:HEAT repeat protein
VALKPLCELYKDFESPTILKAIISLAKKDPKNADAIQTLISALEFTEDKYHNATLAAAALADMKAMSAVEPLAKVLDRPMAIKSRANLAKLAAIKALAKLGDKKAVPYLVRTLERRPEQQDFLLNKESARALGAIGDTSPEVLSVLIRALFMASTIQGTSFPMARVALVKLGPPAVPPLIAALEGKDEKLNKMSKELEFQDGVVLGKISRVLGDKMAAAAVDPLLEILKKANLGSDYTKGIDGVIEAIGRIGDDKGVDPLLKILKDNKVNYKIRMQVCQAFTVMGPKKAIPALLEVAEKGMIEGGYYNLREGAAMAYSRIVGAEVDKGMAKMQEMRDDPKIKEFKATVGVFKEALDRMKVAQECKDDPTCYGKKVLDKSLSLAQREKAGIMIGVLPDGRKALPELTKALPEREPVLRLYFLESVKRIGTASDTELVKLLEELAEKDSRRKVKYLGADLASADKVTLAVVQNRTSAEKP